MKKKSIRSGYDHKDVREAEGRMRSGEWRWRTGAVGALKLRRGALHGGTGDKEKEKGSVEGRYRERFEGGGGW